MKSYDINRCQNAITRETIKQVFVDAGGGVVNIGQDEHEEFVDIEHAVQYKG